MMIAINKHHLTNLVVALIVIILVTPWSGSAMAEKKPNDLEFVYGTNHFDGYKYSSALIPAGVDDIFLMADRTNIIASRLTEIYYWPLTNKYRANWDEANIIVEGTLEILQGSSVISTIELTNYVIQYDALDIFGTLELSLGEEAIHAHQRFQDLREKYRNDLFAFQDAMIEYRDQLAEAQADLEAGKITKSDLPKAPEPLEDMTLFSTEVLSGFPVHLPEGEYVIRLRLPDGSVQADSTKHLTVFKEKRFGVGYNVVSEERWNTPEQSMDTIDTIYSLDAKTLYLQPFNVAQYNQKYYVRMNDPQDSISRSDRSIWVPLMPMEDAGTVTLKTDQIRQIPYERFFVSQLSGSKLGYEIIQFDPESMTEPSFGGYRIRLEESADQYSFFMIGEDGEQIPGSARQIRTVRTNRKFVVYLISSLPLLFGLVFVSWRRSKVQSKTIHE
jgi:hypothetical protein